jgi:hypothetical protein
MAVFAMAVHVMLLKTVSQVFFKTLPHPTFPSAFLAVLIHSVTCDKIPKINNLQEERFIVVHSHLV